MKCPRCAADNRDGVRFCEDCGTRLAVMCPSCGAEVLSGKKFCGGCGSPLDAGVADRYASPSAYTPAHLADRILTSKAALEGERKQVTVLFADLKGSMELLADRDPEEARKILDPVLAHMMEAVHRYEGTVNQVMGDGIMALFGAPLAHEDHAVRACYAALRMQEAVNRYAADARRAYGVSVQIRVGLNSGEVVVRAIGNDLHMDYTAVGETTHLAARMEQLAQPGSVLLAPATLDLVEGFVAVKSLGPVPVKGRAAPVEVYELSGVGPARTRLQAAARRGLTRFVGRDAEVDLLRRSLGRAGDGHGQIVAIVGEAGVGKSRLVYEFAHSHRIQGWRVLEAASVSYGKATSYLPVIDLLRGYFKIQDGDDLREVREKVTGKMLTLDEALRPALPAVLALLDVPVDDPTWRALDPGQRRQRTLDAVKRLLLREAQEQPLVVIFEDLHWIDGETQALLDALVESVGPARILLLVNYRPEYQHGWGSRTFYEQVRLDALAPESAEALLDALLGGDPGVAPVKTLLVRRGNPFFLEESVRTLVETGALAGERGAYRLMQPVDAIQVPATVQTILAARIDRLSAEDKRLLQIASVIGKDVPLALLQAVADMAEGPLGRGLAHLQSAEFIYETRLFPDVEYSFKHALTHEVTYGGVLHERRRPLHGRIVEAIEALHADRIAEHVERLAHHAFRGEFGLKAVDYLRQAGRKAASRSALADARQWLEQALAVLERLPEDRTTLEQAFDTHFELRPVLTQLAEVRGALEHLRAAESIAERLDDDRRRGRVLAFMANVQILIGEVVDALTRAERAMTIARRLDDVRLRIQAATYLVQIHFRTGDYERAIAVGREEIATMPAELVTEFLGSAAPPSVYIRAFIMFSLSELGRFDEAAAVEPEMLRLAEATENPFTIGMVNFAAGILRRGRGDSHAARRFLEHGAAVVRTANVRLLLAGLLTGLAETLAETGDGDAPQRLREAEDVVADRAATGLTFAVSRWLATLASGHLALGHLDDARRLADWAVRVPDVPADRVFTVHLFGDLAAHRDAFDPAEATARYREALALAEAQGMRPLVAHCHLGLGRVARRTDKPREAEHHLRTAIGLYRGMEMRSYVERAESELAAALRE